LHVALLLLFHLLLPPLGVSLDPASQQLTMSNQTQQQLHDNPQTALQFKTSAQSTLAAAGIPVLGDLSYKMSLVMEEQHLGKVVRSARPGANHTVDCLHFCQPGSAREQQQQGQRERIVPLSQTDTWLRRVASSA
jgi:hypothetical protein